MCLYWSVLYTIDISPEVHQVPAVAEDRGNSGAHGELQVLQVDLHGPRRQLCLLGGRHQVNSELDPLLELLGQTDLESQGFVVMKTPRL